MDDKPGILTFDEVGSLSGGASDADIVQLARARSAVLLPTEAKPRRFPEHRGQVSVLSLGASTASAAPEMMVGVTDAGQVLITPWKAGESLPSVGDALVVDLPEWGTNDRPVSAVMSPLDWCPGWAVRVGALRDGVGQSPKGLSWRFVVLVSDSEGITLAEVLRDTTARVEVPGPTVLPAGMVPKVPVLAATPSGEVTALLKATLQHQPDALVAASSPIGVAVLDRQDTLTFYTSTAPPRTLVLDGERRMLAVAGADPLGVLLASGSGQIEWFTAGGKGWTQAAYEWPLAAVILNSGTSGPDEVLLVTRPGHVWRLKRMPDASLTSAWSATLTKAAERPAAELITWVGNSDTRDRAAVLAGVLTLARDVDPYLDALRSAPPEVTRWLGVELARRARDKVPIEGGLSRRELATLTDRLYGELPVSFRLEIDHGWPEDSDEHTFIARRALTAVLLLGDATKAKPDRLCAAAQVALGEWLPSAAPQAGFENLVGLAHATTPDGRDVLVVVCRRAVRLLFLSVAPDRCEVLKAPAPGGVWPPLSAVFGAGVGKERVVVVASAAGPAWVVGWARDGGARLEELGGDGARLVGVSLLRSTEDRRELLTAWTGDGAAWVEEVRLDGRGIQQGARRPLARGRVGAFTAARVERELVITTASEGERGVRLFRGRDLADALHSEGRFLPTPNDVTSLHTVPGKGVLLGGTVDGFALAWSLQTTRLEWIYRVRETVLTVSAAGTGRGWHSFFAAGPRDLVALSEGGVRITRVQTGSRLVASALVAHPAGDTARAPEIVLGTAAGILTTYAAPPVVTEPLLAELLDGAIGSSTEAAILQAARSPAAPSLNQPRAERHLHATRGPLPRTDDEVRCWLEGATARDTATIAQRWHSTPPTAEAWYALWDTLTSRTPSGGDDSAGALAVATAEALRVAPAVSAEEALLLASQVPVPVAHDAWVCAELGRLWERSLARDAGEASVDAALATLHHLPVLLAQALGWAAADPALGVAIAAIAELPGRVSERGVASPELQRTAEALTPLAPRSRTASALRAALLVAAGEAAWSDAWRLVEDGRRIASLEQGPLERLARAVADGAPTGAPVDADPSASQVTWLRRALGGRVHVELGERRDAWRPLTEALLPEIEAGWKRMLIGRIAEVASRSRLRVRDVSARRESTIRVEGRLAFEGEQALTELEVEIRLLDEAGRPIPASDPYTHRWAQRGPHSGDIPFVLEAGLEHEPAALAVHQSAEPNFRHGYTFPLAVESPGAATRVRRSLFEELPGFLKATVDHVLSTRSGVLLVAVDPVGAGALTDSLAARSGTRIVNLDRALAGVGPGTPYPDALGPEALYRALIDRSPLDPEPVDLAGATELADLGVDHVVVDPLRQSAQRVLTAAGGVGREVGRFLAHHHRSKRTPALVLLLDGAQLAGLRGTFSTAVPVLRPFDTARAPELRSSAQTYLGARGVRRAEEVLAEAGHDLSVAASALTIESSREPKAVFAAARTASLTVACAELRGLPARMRWAVLASATAQAATPAAPKPQPRSVEQRPPRGPRTDPSLVRFVSALAGKEGEQALVSSGYRAAGGSNAGDWPLARLAEARARGEKLESLRERLFPDADAWMDVPLAALRGATQTTATVLRTGDAVWFATIAGLFGRVWYELERGKLPTERDAQALVSLFGAPPRPLASRAVYTVGADRQSPATVILRPRGAPLPPGAMERQGPAILVGPEDPGLDRARVAWLGEHDLRVALRADDPGAALWTQVNTRGSLVARSPFLRAHALPADSPVFVGRAAELNEFDAHWQDRDFLILGARWVGKTSLMEQLVARAVRQGIPHLRVEGQGMPDPATFGERAARACGMAAESDPLAAVRRLLDTNPTNGPAILFINEVDGLLAPREGLPRGHESLFDALRGLGEERGGKLRFVFVGYATCQRAVADPQSVFSRVFAGAAGHVWNLAELREAEARDLLHRFVEPPLRLAWGSTDQRELGERLLLERSYRIPWVLQDLCHRLLVRLQQERRGVIELRDVKQAVEEAGPLMHYFTELDLAALVPGNKRREVTGAVARLVLLASVQNLYFGAPPRVDDPTLSALDPSATTFSAGDARDWGTRALRAAGAGDQQLRTFPLETFLDAACLTPILGRRQESGRGARYFFQSHLYPRELRRAERRGEPSLSRLLSDAIAVVRRSS